MQLANVVSWRRTSSSKPGNEASHICCGMRAQGPPPSDVGRSASPPGRYRSLLMGGGGGRSTDNAQAVPNNIPRGGGGLACISRRSLHLVAAGPGFTKAEHALLHNPSDPRTGVPRSVGLYMVGSSSAGGGGGGVLPTGSRALGGLLPESGPLPL